MRDLIWTLILIWLAWQVVNIFRRSPAKRREQVYRPPARPQDPQNSPARSKSLDTEGEYVDFEEIR